MAKVKHAVFVKFKSSTTEDQINQIFDSLLEVSEVVPGIEDYVSGPNMSPEGLNQGYTHAFIITFSDTAARDAYLVHPEHDKVKQLLVDALDGVAVVDFEV